MKNLLKISLSLCLVLFLAMQANAQASKVQANSKNPKRDGVAMKFGKMVRISNGKETPMTQPFEAKGTKVATNGTVTYSDGKKEKLPEGYSINMEGRRVILEDDMIAPEKIREHQIATTGDSGTVIYFEEQTKTVINESTGRKAVRDTVKTQGIKQSPK